MKSLREMTWKDVENEFSYMVHDDLRELQAIYHDVTSLERLGANKQIFEKFKALAIEYKTLHNSFRPFRQEKRHSKQEIERFLLSYHGRLNSFKKKVVSTLKKLEPLIKRVMGKKQKAALKEIVFEFEHLAKEGNVFLSLKDANFPRPKRRSLLSVCREYTKRRIIDREGNPVKVVIRGSHVFANIDPRLVRSGLANLLTDAINHTPGKTLYLNVGKVDDNAVLSVTSKGKFLTRAEIGKIGKVRYTRSKDPDRGWGKLSVRLNTEAQGGRFIVENSRIGPRLGMAFPISRVKRRKRA